LKCKLSLSGIELRIIKYNTSGYEKFYKILPYVNGKLRDTSARSEGENLFNKYITFFNEINSKPGLSDILSSGGKFITSIFPCSRISFFLYRDSEHKLITDKPTAVCAAEDFITKSEKEGLIDWIYEAGTKIIPDPDEPVNTASRFILIIPVSDGKQKKGLAVAYTGISKTDEFTEVLPLLKISTESLFQRIENITLNKELVSAYKDQQLYQSKLLNDNRLSAIGEFTCGIVEEIRSPLQVLISGIDLLTRDKVIDGKSSHVLKDQVNRIESLTGRLLKFSGLENRSENVQPCNFNSLIKEFHNLILPGLSGINYECILDLHESLPPVLSSPGFIHQLLNNLFNIITSSGKKGGGIILQSRYNDGKIVFRMLFTEEINNIKDINDPASLNLRIIHSIMKKHEGECKIGLSGSGGTIIVLVFPLKRKLRQK
jgi:K+-sensing histidine kinase KdpD